jgi:oligosaccharide repeat unit polymerase
VLFLLVLAWPIGGFFGPAAATLLAWSAFAVHLAICGRRLGAFDPGIWIPVLMLLHYFGMTIAVELFRSPEFVDYDAWAVGGPPQLTLSFAAALLTLVAFLAGFHAGGVPDRSGPPVPYERPGRRVLGPSLALLLGGFAFMVGGIPMAGADKIFGSYGDYKLAMKFADADFRFFSTGFLFAQCGIFGLLAAYDRRRPLRLHLALAASVLLALFLLAAGSRAGLSILALAGGWAFAQRVRRVPRWAVVTAFSIAMLFMPIIAEWRQVRDLRQVESSTVSRLAAAIFYEMGSTLPCFSYTLEYIPRSKSYDYGLSVVNQLIQNVPNLGLKVGRRLGMDPLEHDPDNWVTYTANPIKYERLLGGYGYALGAEWYFNFGKPGILFGMLLTGFVTARLRAAGRRSATWLIATALFYGMMLGIVRNDLGYPLRTLLWPLVGLWVLQAVWPAGRSTRSAIFIPQAPRCPPVGASPGSTAAR